MLVWYSIPVYHHGFILHKNKLDKITFVLKKKKKVVLKNAHTQVSKIIPPKKKKKPKNSNKIV